MSSSSDAFERFVHRIHELIEQDDAQVIWNEHFPDPDNPRQARQVDVAIRRDGQLTLVECRIHKEPQDVTWIEELIGRRASLNAAGVIAVSNSGFTRGALAKARRFGIVLRDLDELSTVEVADWGRSQRVRLYYYVYSDVQITLQLDAPSITDQEATFVASAFRQGNSASVFNVVSDEIDKRGLLPRGQFDKPEDFFYDLKPNDWTLGEKNVIAATVSGRVSLSERTVACPVVLAYGSPDEPAKQRATVAESFSLGKTTLLHHGERVTFFVDLSSTQPEPLAQLRFIRLTGEQETDMEAFELLGVEPLQVSSGAIDLALVVASRESGAV